MKGINLMTKEELKKQIASELPVNDPKYLAFKRLKGILGEISPEKIREEKTNAVITRYQHCS